MESIRPLIEKLRQVRLISKLNPVLDALDAALFGTDKTSIDAPHFVDNLDIKRYMSVVIIALLPSALASVYFFGWAAVKIILVSYLAGGLVEVSFAIIRKKEIHEGFLVTGLIFPLTLPPTVPSWVVAVGAAFGVLFGKEVFGGTGKNVFNPALVGRLFVTIAFPSIMTTYWRVPFADSITSATPLVVYKTTHTLTPLLALLQGNAAGSMGEIFRIGLILGGLFLIYTRVSDWRIPFSYLGTVLVMSWVGNHFSPASFAPPLFQLLSGGLLLGAMFMATDPVTSPFTRTGKLIAGTLCGVLTVLIRSISGYVEGVMFSIVLMNSFAPLIDHIIVTLNYRPFRQMTTPAEAGER